MPQRLYLHVGTPKSGTTYVQRVLWQNRDVLHAAGVLLPGRFNTHYAAAKQITGRRGVGKRMRLGGSSPWPTLVTRMEQWPGTAIVSHELLAPATREQAESALAMLGDTEVHLVVTVRGMQKLLSSAWQEQVKAGHADELPAFLEQVRTRSGPRGDWFWSVQHVTEVIDRWGGGGRVPPDRVHVVTCPPDRGDPGLIWRRFASALELPDAEYDLEVKYAKTSLGVVETELLRRVQAARDYRFQDNERHLWIRRLFARMLEERHGDPILLPAENRAWVDDAVAALSDSLTRRGFHLVGDVGDLTWRQPPAGARDVSTVTAHEIADLSAWSIRKLQEELVQRQPTAPYPDVGPDDREQGILELLEHIRAAETGVSPREPGVREDGRGALRGLAVRLRR